MSAQAAEGAVILLDAAGRYTAANAAALEILGVTLGELLASSPDRFAMQPTDEDDRAAFRSEWELGGSGPLVGTSGLKRADGSTIRVSYAITPTATGFEARIAQVPGSPTEQPTVLSAGQVLREWRMAERELAELAPNTPAWARLQEEIELLRTSYQEVFRGLRGSDPSGPSA
jgi:PAS domain S-box-containing protein